MAANLVDFSLWYSPTAENATHSVCTFIDEEGIYEGGIANSRSLNEFDCLQVKLGDIAQDQIV